jgi:hypothetical protein
MGLRSIEKDSKRETANFAKPEVKTLPFANLGVQEQDPMERRVEQKSYLRTLTEESKESVKASKVLTSQLATSLECVSPSKTLIQLTKFIAAVRDNGLLD